MPATFVHRVRRALAGAAGIAIVIAICSPVPAVAATVAPRRAAEASARAGAVDVREPVASARALTSATLLARMQLGRSLGSQGIFELDPRTGTPRVVERLDGFLTGTSSDPARSIAMGFVRRHLDAFGLDRRDLRTFELRDDYVDIDGTHHLSWVQQANGYRAFDNGLKAAVTADGRLVNIVGSPAHALGRGVGVRPPRIGAAGAIANARASVGASARTQPGDEASLVWFHGARSTLAWQTLTRASWGETDLSVIDAATGAVLWRANLTSDLDRTGHGRAWKYYPSSKLSGGGGHQRGVRFPVRNGNRLFGNNAHVYSDIRDDNRPDPSDEVPARSGLNWDYDARLDDFRSGQNCTPSHQCTWNANAPGSWKDNRKQNATQVYYYLNAFHRHLAQDPIGFTEGAGNFQLVNRSGRGKDGDAVQGQVMDGAATAGSFPDQFHYNNANMFTPPDGKAPVMQMYLFYQDIYPYSRGWVSGNGGDDASVVYHEYTHGLSSRLVTYPSGWSALNTEQSASMGEAWSDWYAMDLLVHQGWVHDGHRPGDVKVGRFLTGGRGIRRQGLDCKPGDPARRCPGSRRTGHGGFTYGDLANIEGGPEVHSDGEIWAETLWQIRRSLGAAVAERLITRAMELSPPDPSFLDMRNAILQADVVASGGAHSDALWHVFRGRGMGWFASTVDGDDLEPTESFRLPPDCQTDPCTALRGTVRDSITGRRLAKVVLGVGGHTSGFPGTNLVARTRADGTFRIKHVPLGTYGDLIAERQGYDVELRSPFRVDSRKLAVGLKRDWAALDGGARITDFSKPDYTPFCGPHGAFDRSLLHGWGSKLPGPRSITVKLPRSVDVMSFGVDPGATCGDTPKAAVRAFEILTRTARGDWVVAVRNTTALPQGRLTTLRPRAGTHDVVFVRFIMRSNRHDPFGFMDMSELSVRGRAA